MATHVFREAIIAEILVKGLRNGVWTDEEETAEREERDSGYEGECDGKERRLELPERGCLSREELDEISKLPHILILLPHTDNNSLGPLHYLQSLAQDEQSRKYPPTYLLTGSHDEIFHPSQHSIPFYEELLRQNVPTHLDLQPGLGHAFDVWVDIGSTIGEEILKPAVKWCEQFV